MKNKKILIISLFSLYCLSTTCTKNEDEIISLGYFIANCTQDTLLIKLCPHLNENEYDIDLQAYRQNAHYINGAYIGTETWQNDKPYVIINSAAVDTGEILTIQKRCRIYMNQNSKLIVFGSLIGIGTKEDIDKTMKLGTNVPMGPLTLADFIGLDTCLFIMEVLHRDLGDSKYRPCPLLTNYVNAGYLGVKSGRGFYEYKKK